MKLSGWLNGFRRGIAGQLDALGQQHLAQSAMLQQLLQGQAKIMSAMDDLNKAIDGAVAAMQHAATTIQTKADDSDALEAAATRLNAAAAALSGVDPAAAVADAAAPTG